MKRSICLLLAAVLVFAFAGCNKTEPEVIEPEPSKITGDALKTAIESARDNETNKSMNIITSVNDTGAQQILKTLDLAPESMECYAMSVSLINIKAYAVILAKPAAGEEENVLAAIEAFVERTRASFEDYLPAQAEIADNAVIETLENGVIMLVMSPETEAVRDALVDAVLNPPAPVEVDEEAE